uniref:C2H2-type domain-containing protein n=1 Tax=Gadus morhua TaxID=8049 RepID=A0A8C5C0K7_GADMO
MVQPRKLANDTSDADGEKIDPNNYIDDKSHENDALNGLEVDINRREGIGNSVDSIPGYKIGPKGKRIRSSLQCKDCGKRFNRRETLNLHRHFHSHNDPAPLTCKECGLTFQDRSSFIKHRKEHKEKEQPLISSNKDSASSEGRRFTCANCKTLFSTVEELRGHNCSKYSDKPYRCPLCGREFQFKVAIPRHMQIHSLENIFQCQECNKHFSDGAAFRAHQRCHAALKPYECLECGMVFKHYSVMEDHRRKHTENMPSHQCSVCGKTFKYSSLLHQHQYLHTGQKPFCCPECGKKFAFAQNLKAHYRQHRLSTTTYLVPPDKPSKQDPVPTTEPANGLGKENTEYEKLDNTPTKETKPMISEKGYNCPQCPSIFHNKRRIECHSKLHKCPQCSKMFHQRSVFEAHMRVHSKEKPYLCNVCGKSFRCNSYLRQHLIIHTGEKPHKCPDCGKEFAFLQNMKTHLKLHQAKPFRCGSCHNFYSDASQLKQHMLSHKRPKRHKCQFCDKSFTLACLLRDHINTHNGARPHCCAVCHKSFSWLSSLNVHMKRHERRLASVPVSSSAMVAPPTPRDTDGETKQAEQCLLESCPPVQWKVDGGEVLPVLLARKSDQPQVLTQFDVSMQHHYSPLKSLSNPSSVPSLKTSSIAKESSVLISGSLQTAMPQTVSPSLDSEVEKQRQAQPEKWRGTCTSTVMDSNRHIALVQHQRWHANSAEAAKKFPCEECGKVFMTLTFYFKHQRLVHSGETPAKSFLHQVCQLQKKGFECKDCGLKFSRASALQSHQLQHTDVYKDTEKETQKPSTSLPQHTIMESKPEETNQLAAMDVDLTGELDKGIDSTQHLDEQVDLQDSFQNSLTEVSYVIESDEDAEGYETGDFNVEVISDSESEEDPSRDLNPDLELLCESDQEIKEELEAEVEVSPTSLVLKPGMDLKIVQIDFEHMEQPSTPEIFDMDKSASEKFECPECPRWFSSASSLRVHKMWHGVHRKRRWTVGQHETISKVKRNEHLQKHKDEKPFKSVPDQADGLEKKSLFCKDCGKWFKRMSSFISHQQNHPKRKPYPCLDCNLSYAHASGPKIYHCGQCGKGFWSSGAYSHHKQSPELCLDLRPGKSTSSWKSVLGRPRSIRKVACPVCGRKFRHNGIMKSHMRKHEDGNHKCDLCSRSFRLFSSLLRHQVVHTAHLIPPPIKSFQHQVEQVKKNTYSCPDCGKLFSRAKALQFHMRSHGYDTGYSPSSPKDPQEVDVISTSENMLKCTSCPATFKSAVTFQDHIRECRKITTIGDAEVKRKGVKEEVTNSSKKEVILDEKKLGIRVASSKVNHSGPSDLKYKCKECERSFSVVGALNFHKRIHLQGHKSNAKTSLPLLPLSITPKKQEEQIKRPFYCSECGRRFSSNSALGTHKRWHTDKKFADEGPYHCTKCGKSFFYLCVLRRHQLYYPPCQTKSEYACIYYW